MNTIDKIQKLKDLVTSDFSPTGASDAIYLNGFLPPNPRKVTIEDLPKLNKLYKEYSKKTNPLIGLQFRVYKHGTIIYECIEDSELPKDAVQIRYKGESGFGRQWMNHDVLANLSREIWVKV
jgi:hypothetical protein